MDPQAQSCHNPRCWAYGRAGDGHVVSHSRKERRYRCKRCGKTFSATHGTALYRLHRPVELVVTVVTLLAHGCPIQAIVAAFGLAERTVTRWQARGGAQCQRVHEHVVEAGQVELGQVQADELRVRVVGGVRWLASARAGPSRLWLGGAISSDRDQRLIAALLRRVGACGSVRRVLLCTDGLASYPSQALRLFREAVRTGQPGRPRLTLPAGLVIAQVIKRHARRRLVSVVRRVVTGGEAAAQVTLAATQTNIAPVLNTAYIERLNATFRAHLGSLARRTRAAVHHTATLEAGMWLSGTCYNFCWPHRSLRRRRTAADPPGGRWLPRTPAQAAGLTDHTWSLHELLTAPVPRPVPKRRGRRPHWLCQLTPAA
jgi:transposase-like protein